MEVVMSKFVFILVVALFIHSWLIGAIIKNPDKPEKGQWDVKPQKEWQLDAIGNDLLVNVKGMKVDQKWNLFIAEAKNMKFYVLNPGGKLLVSFGREGQGPGELQSIGTFYLLKNHLISPEMVKYHIFSTKGEFIKDVNTRKWLHYKLFIDKEQLVILSHLPFRANNNPNYIELYNMKTDTRKKLAELKLKEGFLRYVSGGTRIAVPGKKTVPEIVMATDFKSLFYGNSGQYKISKIDFTGKELLSFSIEGRKKNRVSKIAKRKYFESNSRFIYTHPKKVVNGLLEKVPDESPYFSRILIDPKGWIYILLIDLENPNQQAMDIFSPEGKYLYHSVINLSKDFENILTLAFSFAKSELFVFGDDVEGERQLVKYKISLPE